MTVLLIALGAAVGAPARYLIDRAVQARVGTGLPWGTLTVNVAASAVLGLLAGLGTDLDAQLVASLGTGFCGALSTYSTFAYETQRLVGARSAGRAAGYVLVMLVAGIGAAAAALAIGRSVG